MRRVDGADSSVGTAPHGSTCDRVVADLEAHLGDPHDDATVFSYARCAELDQTSSFPEAPYRQLDAWGLARYYVPGVFGGALDDYTVPTLLLAAVARRDLSVAVAHGKSFLGSVCAWVSPSRRSTDLAKLVLDGHPAAWGLTEPGHGSDLLAGELRADAVPGGYRLTGRKWPINNATRGRMITLLARTEPTGGARGFDVFVVDKQDLDATAFQPLPKVSTHGIRGVDISGIAFDRAFVSEHTRLGDRGSGLETVLKSLQLTRTLCSSLSLGAGAHALELGLDFAGDRHLYGRSLLELPRTRAVLADVCAEYLLVQALSLVGVRSIHTLTGEMSLTSAAIKYLAPTRTDRLISNVGQVLGARALLVDGHACGQFEKLARDHRIVGIFDGNTHVNLHAIVNELPTVARRAGRKPDADALTELFDLHRPVPAFDPQRLSLLSRTGSSVFAALPELVRWLQSLGRHRPELAEATALAERLRQHQDSFVTGLAGHRPARVVPAAAFRAAENFTWYLAGSAALGLWLGNHERHDTAPLWREGLWLRAVLRRVLTALGQPPPRSLTDDDTVLATVLDGHRYAAALSLLTSSPTQRGTR